MYERNSSSVGEVRTSVEDKNSSVCVSYMRGILALSGKLVPIGDLFSNGSIN